MSSGKTRGQEVSSSVGQVISSGSKVSRPEVPRKFRIAIGM
jgi:hypothetical protein